MVLFERTFLGHRGSHKMPIILHASHEAPMIAAAKQLGVKGPDTSGYGQAIEALDAGIRQIGHPSLRVVPFCSSNEGKSPAKNVASLKVATGDKSFEIAAIEGEDSNGAPFLMLKNVGNPDYFTFRPYSWQNGDAANYLLGGENTSYISTKLDEQALVFNLAVAQLAKTLKDNLQSGESFILHGHDHAVALATALAAGAGIPTVFTIHNPAYSTTAPLDLVNSLGFALKDDAYGREVDLFALAMERVHWVSTVSPAYAGEIGRSEFKYGPKNHYYGRILQNRSNQGTFVGILNSLPAGFLNPPAPADPLKSQGIHVLFANRLVPQKGYNHLEGGLWLAERRLAGTGEKDVHITVVADGEPAIQKQLARLHEEAIHFQLYPYSERLMFQQLAIADLAVMPSVFEPCGLQAMTAQANGVLALTTRVGGLMDVIGDYDRETTLALGKPELSAGKYGLFFGTGRSDVPLSSAQFWKGLIGALEHLQAKTPILAHLKTAARERARTDYQPARVATDYMTKVYEPLLHSLEKSGRDRR